jgi:hypothetical protein
MAEDGVERMGLVDVVTLRMEEEVEVVGDLMTGEMRGD